MIALDTNILAYAEQSGDPHGRHLRALAIVEQLSTGEHIVPVQVLAEFFSACRKKNWLDSRHAARKIEGYLEVFETPATTALDLVNASEALTRFNLQYFDALIVTVARRAGATLLLSEDMQDGLVVDGLTIVNPFDAANEAILADWLGNAP